MTELPSGTVTFLFTDIEGSTRLLHELGAAYADALAEHRCVLRDAFARHGGVEVDTQGDAFFVAFARASDALSAARDAQAALNGPIRVRMGVHTGEPLVTEEGYVGIDVHRAARIAAAGHGGQVLVSQSTRDLVVGDGLRDLGEHRLKDLTAPERIYQLGAEDFPPLKALFETNLPIQPTPLIGRERELAEVIELVQRHVLVTLTGPGGTGKTRLALQAAADLVDVFENGVWFVSLGAVTDPTLVERTIAAALGTTEALADFLRDKSILLVLDNLEQLLPMAAKVVAALDSNVIATSRERLNVYGEQEYQVPTLSLDHAVALFTDRARLLQPAFEPDEHVEAIAVRLDGLPLALELAAARVKVLTPEQIDVRLTRSLDLLTTGSRDVPQRQRTLRAAIEWSYELLNDDEQRVFARLGVFAGSFDLDAAESVAGANLDLLTSLVDKSLVRQTEAGRFFFLETIREFAAEVFDKADDSAVIRRRHADWYAELAETLAESELAPETSEHSLRRLDADLANIRAALSFLAEADPTTGLRLVSTLWRYWRIRGLFDEGKRWLQLCWAAGVPDDVRLTALLMLGAVAMMESDVATLRSASLERLQLAQAVGSALHEAGALNNLGIAAQLEGDYRGARESMEAALEFVRTSADPVREAAILGNLGVIARLEGRYVEARDLHERSLELFRLHGSAASIPESLCNYADVLVAEGRSREAAAVVRESLKLSDEVGHRGWLPQAFATAASVAAREGRAKEAAVLLGAGKELEARVGSRILDPEQGSVYESTADQVRALLGNREYDSAFQHGRSLSGDEALQAALSTLDDQA